MLQVGLPILIASLLAQSPSSELVHLWGFESEASTLNNRATGRTSFRLMLGARWAKEARRPGADYAIRLTFADGQSGTTPLNTVEGPGSSRLTIDIPADRIRNRPPKDVQVRIEILNRVSSQPVSNAVVARINDFPHPVTNGLPLDLGPFGGGKPLDPLAKEAQTLLHPGPDGMIFVRIRARGDVTGFYIATRETTNRQLLMRVKDYDPRAGRSDEFALEGPDQPALNLTPEQAEAYLSALGTGEGLGLTYRLPTVAEWTLAANAGRATPFWWGDAPSYSQGANLIGPEPGLVNDTTAALSEFDVNPWGLFHTYGNVEEWTRQADGSLYRIGGHFRTEPTEKRPAVKVADSKSLGPDPYVGVRVALDLSAETGAAIVRAQLVKVPGLSDPDASFKPDQGLAIVRGTTTDAASRRLADKAIGKLWFVAAIDNQIDSPSPPPGGLAVLGKVVGPVRKTRPLGRQVDLLPIEVRWVDPLPVSGSDWFLNVFLEGGQQFSHRLFDGEPGHSQRVTLALDLAKLLPLPHADTSMEVALSLGKPATRVDDPNIVSNLTRISWPPLNKIPGRQ